MYMHVYVNIQNNYTQYTHTHVLCKHKLLFWMRLIVAHILHYMLVIIFYFFMMAVC